ncbi:hypothetical protein P154DRAFT_574158 [Amniculicola lignicola CBS 123094]|uniref:Uncharacterized protein n=1 Tax=Amniculicola lignicola CBS 123094 TaxID=1392246 RepID=A0A6A5WMH5_9PLEO|nr:hypothetical protein P154DRAFT_574158 [Amniculicola lignicola CBS 123094]
MRASACVITFTALLASCVNAATVNLEDRQLTDCEKRYGVYPDSVVETDKTSVRLWCQGQELSGNGMVGLCRISVLFLPVSGLRLYELLGCAFGSTLYAL